VSKSKFAELVMDGAEVALKQTMENGLLKDIPLVGSLVKIHEVGASVRDALYTAKITKFLQSLDDVSPEDKERIKDTIKNKKENIEKLTQKILLVLETQTDIEKSNIIANVFLAYIDNKITEIDFRRALDVTASYFLDDLLCFLEGKGSNSFMLSTYEDLEYSGISGLINSPLIGIDSTTQRDLKRQGREDEMGIALYASTHFGTSFQSAYYYGSSMRK
tara:strand:+ start:470 stop:1126 length:657 start_codon:yes stop_codon:yes gene_type:complete